MFIVKPLRRRMLSVPHVAPEHAHVPPMGVIAGEASR
jgi:hypothetical protein